MESFIPQITITNPQRLFHNCFLTILTRDLQPPSKRKRSQPPSLDPTIGSSSKKIYRALSPFDHLNAIERARSNDQDSLTAGNLAGSVTVRKADPFRRRKFAGTLICPRHGQSNVQSSASYNPGQCTRIHHHFSSSPSPRLLVRFGVCMRKARVWESRHGLEIEYLSR